MTTIRPGLVLGLLITLLAPGSSWSQPVVAASDLGGLTLRSIGPANMSGRVVDIAAVESDPYAFYVASATGGIWKTTDNGVTFAPVFEHEAVHSIGDIAVSQSNPEVVWVGTGERANRQSSSWGNGVYKSLDGGESWAHMGLSDSHHIGRVVIHPSNPDIVYVAAMGHLWGPNLERGLFKTTDGGRTWTNVLFVDEDTGVVDVAMDPSNPRRLYAATYQRRRRAYGFHGGGPGSALHASTDAGATWTRLTAGLPEGHVGRIGISVYRSDPRIVYASVEQGLRYNASTAYTERRAGIYRSEDHGDTWTHMSDWNPRPMYASQILVDPTDDQRIYMVNSYSYSDDGGRTFITPSQSLHGDDRLVWVDPNDSRHVIKADDGGLGISYDRGLKWLFVSSLPISQYYRVDVDLRDPYWIYGGLQDNGSWAGPSATYDSRGILNDDWIRIGGGDGFKNLVDPTDNRIVYTESQYLGLARVDLATGQRRAIRPGDPRGHISDRRNWATWGQPAVAPPPLSNAMAPANWDAPYILSPHDARTLYAGTNELWRSTDRGDSWVSLGNLTTGVDRTTLTIMGQRASETVLSLDDGVPYYPTISAIAESPIRRGLLYVGTDDGNVQVSRDGGGTWMNVSANFPGLPPTTWVSGIEASRHDEATAYVAFDGHTNDDFTNYLFRSTDHGRSWVSIASDLPADRVVKSVHEDPRNPALLYVGTELGFFLSLDRGAHWTELKNNLPRVAVNDFVIHPRDNDLVLATHGRGIWILDNLTPLQELTADVAGSDAHLFSIEPARMIRYSNTKAHAGDMVFRGENPPAGAIIDYYLAAPPADDLALSLHDSTGAHLLDLPPSDLTGINRVIWDLRHPRLSAPFREGDARPDEGPAGPLVAPGPYRVRLRVDGQSYEQEVEVREDPRIEVMLGTRRRWTRTLLDMVDLYERTVTLLVALAPADQAAADAPVAPDRAELIRLTRELQSRLLTLYGEASDFVGELTQDQRAQLDYFATLLPTLEARAAAASTG